MNQGIAPDGLSNLAGPPCIFDSNINIYAKYCFFIKKYFPKLINYNLYISNTEIYFLSVYVYKLGAPFIDSGPTQIKCTIMLGGPCS